MIIEIYECDECGARSSHGPSDGLELGWQENADGDTFCAPCLARRPLDPHECDDGMCSHPSGEQREGGDGE